MSGGLLANLGITSGGFSEFENPNDPTQFAINNRAKQLVPSMLAGSFNAGDDLGKAADGSLVTEQHALAAGQFAVGLLEVYSGDAGGIIDGAKGVISWFSANNEEQTRINFEREAISLAQQIAAQTGANIAAAELAIAAAAAAAPKGVTAGALSNVLAHGGAIRTPPKPATAPVGAASVASAPGGVSPTAALLVIAGAVLVAFVLKGKGFL